MVTQKISQPFLPQGSIVCRVFWGSSLVHASIEDYVGVHVPCGIICIVVVCSYSIHINKGIQCGLFIVVL